jgi:hypothetical protein
MKRHLLLFIYSFTILILYITLIRAQWVQTTRLDTGTSFVTTFVTVDSTIFAGTQTSGVLRSANDGATWTPVNSGLPNVYTFYIYSLAAFNGSILIGTN